jgi:hypothetical protein
MYYDWSLKIKHAPPSTCFIIGARSFWFSKSCNTFIGYWCKTKQLDTKEQVYDGVSLKSFRKRTSGPDALYLSNEKTNLLARNFSALGLSHPAVLYCTFQWENNILRQSFSALGRCGPCCTLLYPSMRKQHCSAVIFCPGPIYPRCTVSFNKKKAL